MFSGMIGEEFLSCRRRFVRRHASFKERTTHTRSGQTGVDEVQECMHKDREEELS